MIVTIDDWCEAGRAIDLDAGVPPADVAAAVRTGSATSHVGSISVVGRSGGRLHERVGSIDREESIRARTALAIAARSRGWSTRIDPQLDATRRRLGETAVVPPEADLTTVRRRVAETAAETDVRREQVAEARGRTVATNDADGSAGTGLEDAIRALSEVETTAAAARQAHRHARAEVDRARDQLQERLRLADRVDTLERRARAALVERARPAYRQALEAVPGEPRPRELFDASPDAMALAIARVGSIAAPIILGCGRFPDAAAGARWIRAPVIRLEP